MSLSDKDDLYWDCDDCNNKFTLGNGFIGSINDFPYQMKKEDINDDSFEGLGECHPFMSFVQLCDICMKKKYKKFKDGKKI
jgi:hypothetical protein